MDALEAIRTRRSIRKFQPGKPVGDDVVKEILEAAMLAPSAGDGRPWHFIVIRDRDTLEKQIPTIHPYARFSRQAALAIVVCADTTNERYGAYWQQDCAAATENMLLAVTAKGLGACWCGITPREQRVADFRNLLRLPEHVQPLGMVVIGHPAETKPVPQRFDESRIHQESW